MLNKEHDSPLPPGPDAEFDIGDSDDSLERIYGYFKDYGDIFRVHSPSRQRDTYVISHPDDIKRVLVNNHRNYTKGVGINRVKVLLGNGIMVSEGDFWHRQRRMMQPHFHQRSLGPFYGNIIRCNEQLVQRWQDRARAGEPINITEDTSQVTLDIVLRAIFSDDLERLIETTGDNPFAIVAAESARDLKFAARFRGLSKPIRALIEHRRARQIQRHDLLSMLIHSRDQSGAGMTERALIDEVMTLIVAGHETTASALNWLWYLIACNPETAAAMAAEVDRLDGSLEPEAILGLDHVRRVIDETLRLYPPGWLITRRTIAADRLADCPVPAGTDVFVCPYVVHRHPRYWDAPETFDPSRFEEAAVQSRQRFVYLPFVVGPRHCIGEAFAITEMQFHVAMVVQHLRFGHHAPDVAMEAKVNLRSKNPIMLRAEIR